jgi:hypothetical protein
VVPVSGKEMVGWGWAEEGGGAVGCVAGAAVGEGLRVDAESLPASSAGALCNPGSAHCLLLPCGGATCLSPLAASSGVSVALQGRLVAAVVDTLDTRVPLLPLIWKGKHTHCSNLCNKVRQPRGTTVKGGHPQQLCCAHGCCAHS